MNKQIQINDLIFEKVKFRYDFYYVGRVPARTRNRLFVDTFYPFLLAQSITDKKAGVPQFSQGSTDGHAISERVAQDLGTKHVHISELITMLGYTKTDISKILQAAKNKEMNIALVGLGGTGSNFLHWMYEMSQWTGKAQIFNQIKSFDDDVYDVPNMLRIPFIPEYLDTTAEPLKTRCIPRKFNSLGRSWRMMSRKMTASDMTQNTLGRKNVSVIYGAPGIETRQFLSDSEFTFFAATHRDGEYSIVENPDVDNDLMMETYGKINLSKFFLNHLSMTIDFLKYIGNTDREYETQNKNVEIVRNDFDDQFKEQLVDGFKAGAKRMFIVSGDAYLMELNLPQEVA